MSDRVLSRDAAARIITDSVSRACWAVNLTVVLLTVPLLVETFVERGYPGAIWVPLGVLGVLAAGIVMVAIVQRPWALLAYLAVGGTAAVVYELSVIATDRSLYFNGTYLEARPTIVLVAVGILSATPIMAILWCGLGFVVATTVGVVAAVVADVPYDPGLGPLLMLALALVAYLSLWAVQLQQRRKVPNFEELEAEMRRVAHGENLMRRTTAAVHDTVLNDLAIIINAPERLDSRMRERLLADLDTLRGADWLEGTSAVPSGGEPVSALRNEIMRMVGEFRWRGLNIHITGFGSGGVYRFAPPVADAIAGALRACFENVLRHSGSDVAELELVYGDEEVTFMVVDRGRGFEPDAVPGDRLGIHGSVVERMAAVGGSAKVWSAPGEGTAVMIAAPVHEVIARQPESSHRDLAEGAGR